MYIKTSGNKEETLKFIKFIEKNGVVLASNLQVYRFESETFNPIYLRYHDSLLSWRSDSKCGGPILALNSKKDYPIILRNLGIKVELPSKLTPKSNYSYTISDQSITIFKDNKPYIAKKDHINFAKIREYLKKENFEAAIKLFNLTEVIATQSKGKIIVKNNQVYYNDQPLHNYVTGRILALLKEGFNIKPILNFLEDLYNNNPLVKVDKNHYLVNDLYAFLEKNSLPLNPDGSFLAWKRTQQDGFDIHSQSIQYVIGKVIEEPWESVSKDRGECSGKGLYFGSQAYFDKTGFGGVNHKTFLVKVYPRDVAAVPVSYEHSKGRACKLEVYAEYNKDLEIDLKKSVNVNKPKRDKFGRFIKK